MTSQNLQRVLQLPLLLLQVAPISSLGSGTSADERPRSPVLPVLADQPNNEIQQKTPNATFGNEAAEGRSHSLKAPRLFEPPVLNTSPTAQSHESARVLGM